MKKTILSCLILLLVGGCVKETPVRRKPDAEIPEVKELMTLPEHPTEEDGIFIVANGSVINEELWDTFLGKTRNGEMAELTIACYTIEGDVIYELIRYDGTGYSLFYDNSRDRFGVFSERSERRSYLYDFEYLSEEKMTDGTAVFRNRYAYLSDTVYENKEELKTVLDAGKETDLLLVFGFSFLKTE